MKRRFVRYQVEINIRKPLIPGCYVDGWDGKPRWMVFKYERLPFFCKKCGVLDHLEATCGSDLTSNRFGVWLRAESEVKWAPEMEENFIKDGETNGREIGEGSVRSNVVGSCVVPAGKCVKETDVVGMDGLGQTDAATKERRMETETRYALNQRDAEETIFDISNEVTDAG